MTTELSIIGLRVPPWCSRQAVGRSTIECRYFKPAAIVTSISGYGRGRTNP